MYEHPAASYGIKERKYRIKELRNMVASEKYPYTSYRPK